MTDGCQHKRVQDQEKFKLPIGCATMTGFGNPIEDTEDRILIFLTAENIGCSVAGINGSPMDKHQRQWAGRSS